MRKGERVTQRRQTKVARQSRLSRDQCECASRSAILTGRFAEGKPEFDYAFSNQKQHKYRVAAKDRLAAGKHSIAQFPAKCPARSERRTGIVQNVFATFKDLALTARLVAFRGILLRAIVCLGRLRAGHSIDHGNWAIMRPRL